MVNLQKQVEKKEINRDCVGLRKRAKKIMEKKSKNNEDEKKEKNVKH